MEVRERLTGKEKVCAVEEERIVKGVVGGGGKGKFTDFETLYIYGF